MPVDVKCAVCGAITSLKPSQAKKSKYCSYACKAAAESVAYSGVGSVRYRDAEERFWEKVQKTDGCWTWMGGRKKFGYGNFRYGRKLFAAHRFAYELLVGPIPEGLHVCHHCDNPPCCNPEHLFVGTDQDNRSDCIRKGRHNAPRGERNGAKKYPGSRAGVKNGNAKLTLEQVAEIRSAKGGQAALAARYGVSLPTINRIKCGRAWRSVDDLLRALA